MQSQYNLPRHPSSPPSPSPLPLTAPVPYMSPDPRSTVSSWSTTYTDSGYAPSHGSAPRRRKSSPFPPLPTLQAILRLPRILHCLLSFIPYADFNALTSSCPELRDLMREPVLKDTVLSYFLPGFRSLLRSKTPELFVDVRVTVGDLNIFRELSFPYFFSFVPDAPPYIKISPIKSDYTYTQFMPSSSALDLTTLTNSNYCASYNLSPSSIQNSFSSFNLWLTAPFNPPNSNWRTIHLLDRSYTLLPLESNSSTSRNLCAIVPLRQFIEHQAIIDTSVPRV